MKYSREFSLWAAGWLMAFGLSMPAVSPAQTAAPTVVAWGSNAHGEAAVPADLTNAVAIAAGAAQSLALRADGTLVHWGSGRIASGPTDVPPGLTNVTAIAARTDHHLALRADGTVAFWGLNYSCGDDSQSAAGLTNVLTMADGSDVILVLKADGTVAVTGCLSYLETNVASQLTNVTAIATGHWHSLALKADGTVVGWGFGEFGQTDVPAGLTHVVAVAAGDDYSLALKADGTVVAWGRGDGGETNVPANLTNAVAIAAGNTCSLALLADGTVTGWGPGYVAAPVGLTNVVAIASGDQHWLALTGGGPPSLDDNLADRSVAQGSDVVLQVPVTGSRPSSCQWLLGGVPVTGATNAALVLTNVQPEQAGIYSLVVSNAYGQTNTHGAQLTVQGIDIAALSPSQQIFVGANLTLSVTAAGPQPIYYQWRFFGTNLAGQNAGTLSLTNVQLNQAGPYSVVLTNAYGGLTSGPTMLYVSKYQVKAWGTNALYGNNVPLDLDFVGIAVGGFYYLGLKADGTVISWGPYYTGGTPPADLTNAVAITAGGIHNLAIRADSTVAAWGDNNYGQGNVPAGLTNVVAVAAGGAFSLALKEDGTVVAWGDNESGQTALPPNLTNVIAISAGGGHSLALKGDGSLVAWGYNYYGQTNIPPGLTNVVAVSAGSQHSLVLKTDGTVAVWGDNTMGQLNLPPGLSNIVAIVAGGENCLTLTADNRIVAWGDYGRAQAEVPPDLTNVVAIVGGEGVSMALLGSGPPVLTSRLVNRTVPAGATVALRETATGSRPLKPQWQLNGTNVPAATNAVLILTNVQLEQAGAYTVAVSNSLGKVTSLKPATLTVIAPARIKVPPQSVYTNAGATVILSVTATGSGQLHYQWYWNGGALTNGGRFSGVTSNYLAIAGLQFGDAGIYSVVVSGSAGSDTNAPPAVLNVRQPYPPQFAAATLSFATDGKFQFNLTGDSGSTVQVQTSSNLVDWSTLSSFTLTNSPTSITDGAASPGPRYYRTRLAP